MSKKKLTPEFIAALERVRDTITSPDCPHAFNMEFWSDDLDGSFEDYGVLDQSPADHTCGTIMCIGGTLQAQANRCPTEWLCELTGDYGASDRLFYMADASRGMDCAERATARIAAQAIDQFIATDGEKAWKGIA